MKNSYRIIRLLTMCCLCILLCFCQTRHTKTAGSFSPAIAHDPINGKYFIVYVKEKSDAERKDRIYGAFVDSSGSLLGSEFLISADDASYFCPSVAFDGTHAKYFVVWNSDEYILGQFINSDGSLSGTRLALSNTASAPGGRCSAVVYDDVDQKFATVWGEQNASVHDTINAQFVNVDGSFDGPRLSVTDAAALSTSPSIAYDEQSQRFLVAWDSADSLQIKGRVINSDGTFAAKEFAISSADGTQSRPTTAYSSADGRFLVTWEHTAAFADIAALVGQLLNADGSLYQSLISISAAGRDVSRHATVFNPSSNDYIVLYGDRSRELLYAQIVKSDGTLDSTVSSDNILISYADYPGDKRPAAAYDILSNTYFSVWEYGLDADHSAFNDIHGRLVSANGSPTGTIAVVSNGGEWE